MPSSGPASGLRPLARESYSGTARRARLVMYRFALAWVRGERPFDVFHSLNTDLNVSILKGNNP